MKYSLSGLLKKAKEHKPHLIFSVVFRTNLHRLRKAGFKAYSDYVFPRIKRRIIVDRSKCPENLFDCLKCMHVCTESVFICSPVEYRRPDMMEFKYNLSVGLSSYCTECGMCIDACPNSAISFKK